jgi:hypothetical protein
MGGGDSAPMPYQPANQAGADSAYYSTLGSLTQQNQATAATANAGYNAAYSGVANNPYAQPMVAGTAAAAGNANAVAANDYSSSNLMNLASLAGYGMGGQAASYAAPMAADAATLRSYAPELIQLGLDPNMSEYNFGLKQTQDTQNVANAEQGVAGSPFAAGATGDAMAAYQRNYEASRSTKYMQALQALSALYSGASGLDTSAVDALKGASGLNIDAANLATQGASLGAQGVDMQAAGAAMPYEAQDQVYMDRLAALDRLVNGSTATSANLRGDVQGYGNYLQIGQSATQVADQATQINNQNSFLGGLGQLLGEAGAAAIKFIPKG